MHHMGGGGGRVGVEGQVEGGIRWTPSCGAMPACLSCAHPSPPPVSPSVPDAPPHTVIPHTCAIKCGMRSMSCRPAAYIAIAKAYISCTQPHTCSMGRGRGGRGGGSPGTPSYAHTQTRTLARFYVR